MSQHWQATFDFGVICKAAGTNIYGHALFYQSPLKRSLSVHKTSFMPREVSVANGKLFDGHPRK